MNNIKTIVLGAAVLSAPVISFAATQNFLVDFNTFQSSGGYVGGESAWNTYATPGDVTGAIKDSSGSTSAGYTLGYIGDLGDNSHANYFTNATGGASWATTDGSLANTQAVADYFNSDSTESPAIFTFGGLTAGDTISLDLFASSIASSDSPRGYYSYSLDGGTTYFGFNVLEKDGTVVSTGVAGNNYFNARSQGNDLGYYMNVSSLTVGAAENVMVQVQQNTGFGRYAVISAMQLSVTPVPEPSTYALLAGCFALGAVMVRRRA